MRDWTRCGVYGALRIYYDRRLTTVTFGRSKREVTLRFFRKGVELGRRELLGISLSDCLLQMGRVVHIFSLVV